eukprot:gene3132-5884_t
MLEDRSCPSSNCCHQHQQGKHCKGNANVFIHDEKCVAGMRGLVLRINVAELEVLVRTGQVPVKETIDGTTMLHTLAEFGKLDHVKVLLSHGVDVNATDVRGLAPLHLAVQFGHEEIVDELIAAGAFVDQKVEFVSNSTITSRLFGTDIPVRPIDLARQLASDTGVDPNTRATGKRIYDKLSQISSMSPHPPNSHSLSFCNFDVCSLL